MSAKSSFLRMVRAIRKGSGFAQARGRDPDFEQAILRVAISVLVFAYATAVVATGNGFTNGLIVALLCSGANASIGAWMCWWLKGHTARPSAMRLLGICSDLATVTIGMAGGDEAGVPLIGVYLWVTVGNGFRFGPKYLMVSYWLSLVGFVALMAFVPFWQTHRPIGIGFTLILAGVPLYVLVLLSRLTAQKNEAEQLSNAKSRFVANVSHELRTPLTGVFAVHELLRMRKMTSDDRELVGMLGSAIGTLKQSVDAVLQMSKLEAGAERTEQRAFNVWYFLQQLETLCRPQASAKGLAWSVQLEPDVPCAVVGDPKHLSHVLGNLINNAFKFTNVGGVTLCVRKVTTDRLRFEVVDTGIGIPIDHQERLFERFVQVDTSARRRHEGTGLGTSIAHDLVKLMGGDIGVVSAPGQGSRFWIELPLPTATSTVETHSSRRVRAVLLVADDTALRDERLTTLRTLGLTVHTCEPASDSAPSLSPDKYSAALLLMSAADAGSYAESFLKGRAGTICPWLVLSPAFSETQFASLQKLGASGLFEQNIPVDDLRAQLTALDGRIPTDDVEEVRSLPRSGIVRRLTILLADDNRSNRLLFTRILEDAGHSVRSAERGDHAFDVMAAGGIDLALLDLNMPDISGPDVVKLFRASSIGGEKLPIVILSADATPAAKTESLQAGADDFLTKPVTSATLLAAIERLVAGSNARTDSTVDNQRSAAGSENWIGRSQMLCPADNQHQLVDADRIQSLQSIARGERRFLEQYMAAAFAELEDAIGNLRVAVTADDTHAARDALHIIIGTGASVGADALAENAKALGAYLSVSSDPPPPSVLAELSTTYALTKSAVSAIVLEQLRTITASGRLR